MILKFSKDFLNTEVKANSSGSKYNYNYSLSFDEKGEQYLEAEKYDQQAIIDSYADQCSIERILISHGLGDELVMNSKPGVYLDEDEVNSVKMASDTNAINNKLAELFRNFKGDLSFDEFRNAILTGQVDKLIPKTEEKKEVVDNA